jgi:hypothetical protein
MTLQDFFALTAQEVGEFIEKNLDQDPSQLALDQRNNAILSPLVFTQLKYLQRSRKKLPSYSAARCIIPPRAYEQSSSEATARLKDFSGHRALDLSCGLGVDSLSLSRHFDQLTSLEADPVLAEVTRYNFTQLGAANISLQHQTAEDFLTNYQGPPFDLIYADPDRRDEQQQRQVRLEHCQPQVLQLMPLLQKHGSRLLLKLSPLFDLAEAERLFQPWLQRLTVVSVDNECKEVWVDCVFGEKKGPVQLEVKCIRKENVESFAFQPEADASFSLPHKVPNPRAEDLFLLEPDVAFYKARCLPALMKDFFPILEGTYNHEQGYFFTEELPPAPFPGRIFNVKDAFPYKPKALKKQLGKEAINITRRHFPLTVRQIRKQLKLSEGGKYFLICTQLQQEKWAFLAERVGDHPA